MSKGGANGYAALSKKRAASKAAEAADDWVNGAPEPKRRKLDDYETPMDKVEYLVVHGASLLANSSSTLEPAAGSGRLAAVLEAHGHKVTREDIKTGQDFTKRTKKFKGNIVTNPPYRDGLADMFVMKALELADGGVAMLMEAKYLFGSKRNDFLWQKTPPALLIFIPERVYFYEGSGPDAAQIPSQFFNHVWIVWPDRSVRMNTDVETRAVWACASEFG